VYTVVCLRTGNKTAGSLAEQRRQDQLENQSRRRTEPNTRPQAAAKIAHEQKKPTGKMKSGPRPAAAVWDQGTTRHRLTRSGPAERKQGNHTPERNDTEKPNREHWRARWSLSEKIREKQIRARKLRGTPARGGRPIPRRTGYNISDRERGATLQHIQKRDPESERKIDPDGKNQHWHVNRK
jgi:hypothetical protein